MALVDYASSDDAEPDRSDHGDDGQHHAAAPSVAVSSTSRSLPAVSAAVPNKRKTLHGEPATAPALPPLPARFHNVYAAATRISTHDDPALHGGRSRALPHIPGNWPTHLYIEWHPTVTDHDRLTALIGALAHRASPRSKTVESLLRSDLGAPLPLHISLSRTIGLTTDRKDEFVANLQHAIAKSRVRPFDVTPASLHWVSNFESTRWFLVMRVERPPHDELNRLLALCNGVVGRFGQPALYSTASDDVSDAFHISIAWTLEPPHQDVRVATDALMRDAVFRDMTSRAIPVGEVKAKVGNVITSINLPRQAAEQTSLFGL